MKKNIKIAYIGGGSKQWARSFMSDLAVANLVHRNCLNIDTTYEGIKHRDLRKIYAAFADQPLCGHLSMEESFELFRQMCYNTRQYLDPYFDLDAYFSAAQ